ncbi:hemagglutinin/amebocyte aggregation factor-like [Mya arenaria]|uniref:hemagglutinin/amebocyte aggregation factor-like n=1 Tax=Mya arenaria TaxID=6604 RepID=UPI0022DF75C3|nr:hemagglutinin/amebocyte aggregation factor-like [Mya arenaria]XP_052803263.1 hemagglutinin/amebocyte aggregation factor-like [Mya arenaria]
MAWFLVLSLLVLNAVNVHSAANNFDQPVNFNCPKKSQSINHIHSQHDNYREDRLFTYECKEIPTVSSDLRATCYKTGYVNAYDEEVLFKCEPNYYINGIHSVHNNYHEDRIWAFTCCHIPDFQMHGCKYSGWTNDYDHLENFYVEHGHVLAGVISRHNNYHEDRIFQYEICQVARECVDVFD